MSLIKRVDWTLAKQILKPEVFAKIKMVSSRLDGEEIIKYLNHILCKPKSKVLSQLKMNLESC